MFKLGVLDSYAAGRKPRFMKKKKVFKERSVPDVAVITTPAAVCGKERIQQLPQVSNGIRVELNKFDEIARLVSSITQNSIIDYDISRITRTLLDRKIKETVDNDNNNNNNNKNTNRNANDNDTNNTFERLTMNNTVHQLLIGLSARATESMGADDASAEMINRLTIPVCTMEHHKTQLRSVRGHERSCVKGAHCDCYIQYGFIMKEFLTHEEERQCILTNTYKSTHSMCLYCIREQATMQYALAAIMKVTVHQQFSMQDHQILVNVPGEYRDSDCIPIGVISVYPQILNTPRIYRAYKADDCYYLQQLLKPVTFNDPQCSLAHEYQNFQ